MGSFAYKKYNKKRTIVSNVFIYGNILLVVLNREMSVALRDLPEVCLLRNEQTKI